LTERETAREGTQAGGVGEGEAGFHSERGNTGRGSGRGRGRLPAERGARCGARSQLKADA